MSQHARKKTFVDPKVQGALVRRMVLHWVAFFAVASLVAFCLQLLTNPFRPFEQLVREVWWTHGPFLLVLFFMLPVFIVDTIKLSHRFAGPIYRLRNVIRSIAHGDRYQPLKFREFDFWQGWPTISTKWSSGYPRTNRTKRRASPSSRTSRSWPASKPSRQRRFARDRQIQ
jgi:hypothetical protein